VSAADVPFYTALAAQAGGVLELGCGSGRVLLPCAEAVPNGGPVAGVDRSPAMLALARRRAGAEGLDGRVELVDGDLRSVRLGRRFPLVTIPFRTLFHLRTDDEWLATMATVHAHLGDGGLLAGDVFVPDPELLAAGERLGFTGEFETPGGGRVAVWDHWSVDVAAQIARRRRVAERLDPDGLVTERRHHLAGGLLALAQRGAAPARTRRVRGHRPLRRVRRRALRSGRQRPDLPRPPLVRVVSRSPYPAAVSLSRAANRSRRRCRFGPAWAACGPGSVNR
jgi:SAM-dependent methyltransferase